MTISGLRTSLGMVRLMLALVACATTSGQALALSSACTTVNSGVYNKTNSVSFSDDLGTGFAAGETVTFVISGTGGTFYVDVDDRRTLGIAGYARATDDRSEPGDERFLSRHRRLSRDANGDLLVGHTGTNWYGC